MDSAALLTVYRFTHLSLERNLQGLTDEEALVAPGAGGNCVNWLVGHILLSRDGLHALLGLAPAWDASLPSSEPYRRGSHGPMPDGVPTLALLRVARERSQAQVLERLEQVSADRLAERVSETMTVAERLGFFGFHEAYHVGQAGLSRRLLGKAGAIA
ncbi:MAG: DinB family protein [Gemmatimonadales bacterium]